MEALVSIISKNVKEQVDTSEIKKIPLAGLQSTYEIGDYWIRVLRAEPKQPDWSATHREFSALERIHAFNRKTADLRLHTPITIPVNVGNAGDILDRPWQLCRKVKGELLLAKLLKEGDMSLKDAENTGAQIGKFLARIHSIPSDGAGLMGSHKAGIHPGPWQKYMFTIMPVHWEQIKKVGMLKDDLIDRLADICEKKKGLFVGETVNLVHNDFQFANMFVDRNKEGEIIISGIINFEQVGVGCALVDISTLHCYCWDERMWKSFQSGYSNIRSMPSKSEEKLPIYEMLFSSRVAAFYHAKKDEKNRGYFLRRLFEAATLLDSSFEVEASQYRSFDRPAF